jgi:hypothetical protein
MKVYRLAFNDHLKTHKSCIVISPVPFYNPHRGIYSICGIDLAKHYIEARTPVIIYFPLSRNREWEIELVANEGRCAFLSMVYGGMVG